MRNKEDYSLIRRIHLTLGLCLFAFLSSLSVSLYLMTKDQIQERNKKTLNEQIDLVVNTLDKYSLKDQYDYISKTLFRLNLVDEVTLFSKNCNVLMSIPLNITLAKNCLKYEEDVLIYRVTNSFKDAGISAIRVKIKNDHTQLTKAIARDIFPILLFFIILSLFLVFYFNKKLISNPINKLVNSIETFSNTNNLEPPIDTPIEITSIYDAIIKKNIELKENAKLIEEKREKEIIAQTAEQAAHDINSPLSVLEQVLKKIPNSELEYLNLGKMVVKDIYNIIEKIGKKQKDKIRPLLEVDVSDAFNQIIKQKKLELQSNPSIIIEHSEVNSSDSFFALIHPTEFNIMVSNLINNSVQAIKGKGKIKTSFERNEKELVINIQDNGVGISKDNMSKILKKGISIGKENGKGLGLSAAIEKVKLWGGDIKINSEEGAGTTVSIIIPLMTQESQSNNKFDFVQIEDYSLLRALWKSSAKENNIKLLSIEHPNQFYKYENNISQNAMIYVDSHFGDSDLRGEEWAQNLSRLGYKNIFLASNEESIKLSKYPYIKKQVSKNPPWIF